MSFSSIFSWFLLHLAMVHLGHVHVWSFYDVPFLVKDIITENCLRYASTCGSFRRAKSKQRVLVVATQKLQRASHALSHKVYCNLLFFCCCCCCCLDHLLTRIEPLFFRTVNLLIVVVLCVALCRAPCGIHSVWVSQAHQSLCEKKNPNLSWTHLEVWA